MGNSVTGCKWVKKRVNKIRVKNRGVSGLSEGIGNSRDRGSTKEKFTAGGTEGLLFLGKQLIDIEVAWIEDSTKSACKVNDNNSEHVRVGKYRDVGCLLRDYTMVLLGESNYKSCKLRRLLRDYERPRSDMHRCSAFGSKYFNTYQWTGLWRKGLQPYLVRARRVADKGGGGLLKKILGGLWAWAAWVQGSPGCVIGCAVAVRITARRQLGTN